MNKCIYSLKDAKSVSFDAREHIFPKYIGGVETLPEGWVSKEFNNEISKSEREFARNETWIVLPRILNPSMGYKQNRGIVGMGFLTPVNNPIILLGYMANSIHYPISQLVTRIDWLNQVNFQSLPYISLEFNLKQSLVEILSNYKKSIEVIKHDNEKFEDFLFVGFTQKQVYVGVNENINNQDASKYAKQIIDRANKNTLTSVNFKEPVEVGNDKNTVIYTQYQRIIEVDDKSDSDVQRVYAKIVFNVLAKIVGQEFVMRKEFNKIREAIVSGNRIEKIVSYRTFENVAEVISLLELEGDEHFVYIKKEKGELLGLVNLFGKKYGVLMVVLSEQWNEDFKTLLYVCDWKNQKEYFKFI